MDRIRAGAAAPVLAAWRGVRGWQVWTLPEPLRACVVAVPVLALGGALATGVATAWRVRDVAIFVALLACGAAAIEATRTLRDPQGTLARDLQSVWYMAISVVLPPPFAFIAPAPLAAHRLLRTRRMLVYRRVYSNATLSIGYGCASIAFHRLPAQIAGPTPGAGSHVLAWVTAVAGCGLLGWLVNASLVILAARLSDPSMSVRDLMASRESLAFDLLELSLAVSLTLIVAINPLLMALALPSVVLCRRYLMQSQLVAQSRIDTRTGLLNAETWRREASAELSQALRARAPVAVVLLDVDHFDSVSETAGVLAGDQVLRVVAATVREHLSRSALVGLFGRERFAILLPCAGEQEARRIGERIRDEVAGQSIAIEDGCHAGFVFRLTVSIGIAVLDQSCRALAELVGAAGTALSQAQSSGRNRVCVVPGAVQKE